VESALAAAASGVAPRTCRRCLREGRPALVEDPALDVCPRCKSALLGNSRALVHGLRSRPELHPDTVRLFVERVERILTDNGKGDDNAVYTFGSQARDYIRLELLIETGFAAVVDEGASPKVVSQVVNLIATKARLAQQLGLERRPRLVDPIEGVRQAVEEANRS
jgi:hypothetical protein